MRKFIWNKATDKHPEGCVLTRPLLILKAILYPLEWFYWHMGKARGYQYESDTWDIEGIKYTGKAMRLLANSQGETYRITRVGYCITLERVDVNVNY